MVLLTGVDQKAFSAQTSQAWKPLLILATLMAAVWQLAHPQFGFGDEMTNIARSVAAHGTFSNPFDTLEAVPNAAQPPLFPLLMAACIRIVRSPGLWHRLVQYRDSYALNSVNRARIILPGPRNRGLATLLPLPL